MFFSAMAICLGASAGALCRWLFNLALNPLFSAIPPGTLAVNWLGSFLMGIALSVFAMFPTLNQYWKLFFITGFLGSFTTFSAFSGEMGALLMEGRPGMCAMAIGLHVIGSIGMLFVGMWAFSCLKKLLDA